MTIEMPETWFENGLVLLRTLLGAGSEGGQSMSEVGFTSMSAGCPYCNGDQNTLAGLSESAPYTLTNANGGVCRVPYLNIRHSGFLARTGLQSIFF